MFSSSYIEGRRLHLVNKMKAINESFNHPMPEDHFFYKVKKLIPAVEKALQNIDNNCYGVCNVCEEEISQKRLNIRPEALTCVDCLERSNKNVRKFPA